MVSMQRWAIVDLETTGGAPGPDRITEIGVVLLDGTEEVGQYQSLVYPGRPIPSFVKQLTGITDEMVRGAPSFHQLAGTLLDLFADRVVVAHNAPFDVKFLRHEFAQCGIAFDPARLCTVQASRRLFPGYDSYSLGKFADAIGIGGFRHHRALGDALACAGILRKALMEHGEEKVCEGIKGLVVPAILPKDWSAADLMKIPDAPGVLWFHGTKGQLLYVCEAPSLRVKALHVLSMGRRSPLWAARQGLESISHERTGSELLARILAIQEIIGRKPSCNKAPRLPSDSGAPLGSCMLVGPGRDDGEKCLIGIRNGKVWGYRFLQLDESLEIGDYWSGFEKFRAQPDPILLIRQQINRGGGGWRLQALS